MIGLLRLAVLVCAALFAVLAWGGCTPSSTQWEHRKERYESCRIDNPDDLKECDHLKD